MKKIVRKKTSGRPEMKESKKIKKKQRGGSASKRRTPGTDFYVVNGQGPQEQPNAQRRGADDRTGDAERRLSVQAIGQAKRQCEQLCKLGKLDRNTTVKTEHNVPERWADAVPLEVNFTVEGLLKAMVTGKIKPLYNIEGKHTATTLD